MPSAARRPVFVAGGVGIAPFVCFSRALAAEGRRALVLLGGRTERDLYLREDFEALGMEVRSATEDGSFGRRGRVTLLLEDLLAREPPEHLELYSCGPTPMLVKVAAIARERSLPHQVSIERRMGCGMGCCLGCVVFVRSERGGGEYLRSCTEGPVFDAESLDWDRDPYPL
jgi:dihydroorotate dehydrogenase electron transfer subunit